jgi:hypothetical protein
MINHVSFLFGSGISIPAGFPKTNDITNKVLSGDNIYHFSDDTYYIRQNAADLTKSDPDVSRIISFLRLISDTCSTYYFQGNKHEINYEDLFYIINQMEDCISGEYENPIADSFIRLIQTEIDKITSQGLEDLHRWETIELLNQSENYIIDTVWRSLQRDIPEINFLQNIIDACLDNEFINIFTLNHDLVLETLFSRSNITYTDGFGDAERNNVRYWNPSLLFTAETKIKVIKLHGSINWFNYPPNEHTIGSKALASVPADADIWHIQSLSGDKEYPYGGRPLVLVGTFNKILQYTNEIFADLYCCFLQSLKTTNIIIISGYGFGDKGINNQIIEWMYKSKENRIIVIHKSPSELFDYARNAIKKHWASWEVRKRLHFIRKNIEDTSWAEIKEVLSTKN